MAYDIHFYARVLHNDQNTMSYMTGKLEFPSSVRPEKCEAIIPKAQGCLLYVFCLMTTKCMNKLM